MARLGQNFLADPNLLDATLRHAELGPDDVVLEVGAGEGVLTERLAAQAAKVHSFELDRELEPALREVSARDTVELHWADAMRADLGALDPPPDTMVANLPYSVATPVLIRTVTELPSIRRWTVMIQLEIAERLRAAPGSRTYGAPSVIIQWGCEVRLLRRVDRAVFTPRPGVDSALFGIRRTAPAPGPEAHQFIRDAFAHRRKSLARSVEIRRPGRIEAVRAALAAMGQPEDARAESLSPQQFRELTAAVAPERGSA